MTTGKKEAAWSLFSGKIVLSENENNYMEDLTINF
jgi:hypothetical protein